MLLIVEKDIGGGIFHSVLRFINVNKKETLCPLFMDGVQLPQGYRATTRRQFTFYRKFSKIPGTHLIDLRRMKG